MRGTELTCLCVARRDVPLSFLCMLMPQFPLGLVSGRQDAQFLTLRASTREILCNYSRL